MKNVKKSAWHDETMMLSYESSGKQVMAVASLKLKLLFNSSPAMDKNV